LASAWAAAARAALAPAASAPASSPTGRRAISSGPPTAPEHTAPESAAKIATLTSGTLAARLRAGRPICSPPTEERDPMLLGTGRGSVMGLVAALALILACASSAPAQNFKYNYCPPCYHPFYGAYPTCWSLWPPGWNCWNCGRGPVQGPGQITARPRQPGPGMNLEEE